MAEKTMAKDREVLTGKGPGLRRAGVRMGARLGRRPRARSTTGRASYPGLDRIEAPGRRHEVLRFATSTRSPHS